MDIADSDAKTRLDAALAEKDKQETPPVEQKTEDAEIVKEVTASAEPATIPVAEKTESIEKQPTAKKVEETDSTTTKEWWEDDAAKTAPSATKDSDDKEKQAQITAELSEKAKQYEELMADADFQAFVTAKKTGKDLISYINEIKGTDVSKLTNEEIFRQDLVSQKYTEDEIEAEMAAFNDKLKSEKDRIVKPIRQELMEEQREKLKKFTASSLEEQKKQAEITKKQEAHRIQAIQHTEKYKNDIVGKELYGIKITKEMAETAYDDIMHKSAVPIKEDGSIDVETYFNNLLALRNLKQIVKVNIDRATNNGRKEILDEVSRVSRPLKTSGIPDKASEMEKDLDEAKAKARAMNPVYAGLTN